VSGHRQTADDATNDARPYVRNRRKSIIHGLKIIALSGIILAGLASGLSAVFPPASRALVISLALGIWIVWSCLVLCFFRDAEPRPPTESGVVVAPTHGTVDYVDDVEETQFMGARTRRVSIYLSLRDVHVQNAPVSGQIQLLRHFPGRFARAVRRDASLRNDHLLLGFAFEGGGKMAVRWIAGIVVRRTVPWVRQGDAVLRGQRIGLICFGSRVDVFLPLSAQVAVQPGAKLRGGETVLARWPEPGIRTPDIPVSK
jgi:phosphatidylserine decarboxylase